MLCYLDVGGPNGLFALIGEPDYLGVGLGVVAQRERRGPELEEQVHVPEGVLGRPLLLARRGTRGNSSRCTHVISRGVHQVYFFLIQLRV